MTPKRLTLLAVLFIALLTGVWVLMSGYSGNALGSGPETNEVSTRTNNEPIHLDTEPDGNSTPEEIRISKTPSHDADSKRAVVSEQEILYIPDYGPLLQRAGGVVSFEIMDAKGERAKLYWPRSRLTRLLGGFSLAEGVERDYKDNIVKCGGYGPNNVGLEPGEYELEVNSSRWGYITHKFSLAHGEKRTKQIKSRNYPRTICFDFRDQFGHPVSYLPHKPTVSYTIVDNKERTYRQPDTGFLTSPPGLRGYGGFRYRRARGSGA